MLAVVHGPSAGWQGVLWLAACLCFIIAVVLGYRAGDPAPAPASRRINWIALGLAIAAALEAWIAFAK